MKATRSMTMLLAVLLIASVFTVPAFATDDDDGQPQSGQYEDHGLGEEHGPGEDIGQNN